MNDLAERVRLVDAQLKLAVEVKHIENPRKELEEHYYNPAHSGLLQLGLPPHFMTNDVVAAMLERVLGYRNRIVAARAVELT